MNIASSHQNLRCSENNNTHTTRHVRASLIFNDSIDNSAEFSTCDHCIRHVQALHHEIDSGIQVR